MGACNTSAHLEPVQVGGGGYELVIGGRTAQEQDEHHAESLHKQAGCIMHMPIYRMEIHVLLGS